ncbi:MAG: hypothetical protein M9958_01320 [Chitinophagales bacterium]|nr:hypothetical protein [Chitinophagales bacterium]
MNKQFYLFLFSAFFIFTSCDKETFEESTSYQAELDNIANNVILPTYKGLADAASDLKSAIVALKNDPSVANLNAAREAWKATRVFWEQSEGFLFGPVDQHGIDPSIDSWPLNIKDLDNVLNSGAELTVSVVQGYEETLKGFHTIEYLLWGAEGGKLVSDFTEREFEYLLACSGVLSNDTQKLYDLWDPSKGNFIAEIIKAGHGSSIYISEKSALEEISNALVGIVDEVGNSKIDDPFSEHDVTLEESRFSNNSKSDFADNIRSVQNIYTGKFNDKGNGQSINTLVKAVNPALDTKIRTQITASIEAIININGTFTSAVENQDKSVVNAQSTIRELQSTLESELLPLISNL